MHQFEAQLRSIVMKSISDIAYNKNCSELNISFANSLLPVIPTRFTTKSIVHCI